MNERKVIQIVSFAGGIQALCDDGTVWVCYGSKKQWVQYPDIPQEDSNNGGW